MNTHYYGWATNEASATSMVLEMIGRQYKIINGEYTPTGMVSPRGFMVIAVFFGEATLWSALGVPTVGHISHNAPQFSQDDTPDTVMFEALRPTTAAFAEMIQDIDAAF